GRQVYGRRRLSVHGAALVAAHRGRSLQVAQHQGLHGSRRGAAQGAGSAQGRRAGLIVIPGARAFWARAPGIFNALRGFRNDTRYFSGCPIVIFSVPTPSTSHSILSPATVAATPDGVPVRMMSPGASSTISESLEMTSGTFQII